MKKSKPSAFLICENPMSIKSDNRVFILHTREPMIFAEAHHYQFLADYEWLEIERGLPISGRLDYPPETVFFRPIWIAGEKEDDQKYADKLAKTLRRMADWYKSYLIWEDNHDEKEKGA